MPKNTRRGGVIVCFNFFEKIDLDPSLVPDPYLLPF
jgi:hypothetical protein